MRCLLSSTVLLFLITSCGSDYRHLRKDTGEVLCESSLLPLKMETSWYDASVDVTGKHISGLLLMKNMPDSSKRVVFTNEAGITFFDFSFSKIGDFRVINIVKQLNKKAVIRTLEKDFRLILGLPFQQRTFDRYLAGEEVYFEFKQKNGTAYFITSKDCASLQRLEWAVKGKRMVTVRTPGSGYPLPEKIELNHHTFNMQIKLNRIEKE